MKNNVIDMHNECEQNNNVEKKTRAAIDAINRHAALRNLVYQLEDAVNYLIEYAIACQYESVFFINDDDCDFFFDVGVSMNIYESLIREHPDVSALSKIENGYVIYLADDKCHHRDGEQLKRLTADEVIEMCDKHVKALDNGDDYRADFSGCMISNVDFSDIDVSEMCFKGASLLFCDFSMKHFYDTDFSNVIFFKCKMSESFVYSCNFSGASFCDSSIADSSFHYCDFKSAKFIRAFACDAELDSCNLTDTINDQSFTDNIKTSTSVKNEVAWLAIRSGRD